jgi:ADP-ribose pyrophosphatase
MNFSKYNRRQLYKGRIVDLGMETATLPNGFQLDLEIVRHIGAAAVIAVTKDQNIILLKQYRHATGGEIYEIPAGLKEPGEDPVDCAKRELREEAQYTSNNFIHLGHIYSTPGFCDEKLDLYAAIDIVACDGQADEDEFISEIIQLPLAIAKQWIVEGKIVDAKSICAISTYVFWQEGLSQ